MRLQERCHLCSGCGSPCIVTDHSSHKYVRPCRPRRPLEATGIDVGDFMGGDGDAIVATGRSVSANTRASLAIKVLCTFQRNLLLLVS